MLSSSENEVESVFVQHANAPAHHGGLLKIIAYLSFVLLGGACFAPLLFWGGQWLLTVIPDASRQGNGALAWISEKVGSAGFTRFFNRAMLVVALTSIWPFIRWAGFERAHFPRWKPAASGLGQLAIGFFLAAALLLTLGWAFTATGVYRVRSQAAWFAVGGPLLAAFSVGFIEEFFFRGALLSLLLRSMTLRAAVLWSTLVFAIVHFLNPPEGFQIPHEQVSWLSGFRTIAAILGNFGHVNFILAEFCTLFAVGWVLATTRMSTGRLWASIGLHAGWVFGLKYFGAVARTSKPLAAGDYLPWIGVNLKTGLVPLLVVLLTGYIMLRLVRGERTSRGATEINS